MLSTCIPYKLNIVTDYAITQYRTIASEIAHIVHIVCSGLKTLFVAMEKTYAGYYFAVSIYYSCKLKLQITMDKMLPFLSMSAQSQFSALSQLRHSPPSPI